MNSSPQLQNSNQIGSVSKRRTTGFQNGSGEPMLGPSGLNPAAPAFVPGPSPAGLAARGGVNHTEKGARGGGGRIQGQSSGGRDRGRGGKEGGLSRALRSNRSGTEQPKPGEGASGVVTRKAAASRDSGESAPDPCLLGRSPQQRYTSANHLLNFQPSYPQRKGRGQTQGGSTRGRGSGRRQAARPLPYDRKKFLQANFRFLVGDAGNLRDCQTDPDLAPDWEDVVEVEMMVEAALRCPISLDSPPLCPQITPCGHVFSFPSIMAHLMNHGGDNLRRASPCPLCYTPVVARELRLLNACTVTPPQVGAKLTFVLLKRPKSSVIPLPAHDPVTTAIATTTPGPAVPTPWKPEQGDTAGVTGPQQYNPYAAFTPIKVEDATQLWNAAAQVLADYAVQVTAEGGMEAAMEAPFVYAALDALASRTASWAERRQRRLLEAAPPALAASLQQPEQAASQMGAAVKRVSSAAVTTAVQQREVAEAEAKRAAEFPSLPAAAVSAVRPPQAKLQAPAQPNQAQAGAQEAFSEEDDLPPAGGPGEGGGEGGDDSAGSDGASPRGRAEGSTHPAREMAFGVSPGDSHTAPTPDTLYFYQSEDGQWVFLTSFNMRALVAHYGNYAALPPRIHATLLELEELVQSDAVRRRHKFLAHLPLTGTFRLAEVELGDLLPPDAVAPFSEEVRGREQRRQRRVAADARREAVLEAAAAAAAAASAPPSMQQLRAMPLPSEAAGLAGRSEAEILEDVLLQSMREAGGEGKGAAFSPPSDHHPGQPQSGISFASITRMGYAATGPPLSTTPPLGNTPSTRAPGGPPAPPIAASPPGTGAGMVKLAWGKVQTPTPTPTPGPAPAAGSPLSSGPGMVKLAWGRDATTPAPVTPRAPPLDAAPPPGPSPLPQDGEGKLRKKGGKKMLLMSTAVQRKY